MQGPSTGLWRVWMVRSIRAVCAVCNLLETWKVLYRIIIPYTIASPLLRQGFDIQYLGECPESDVCASRTTCSSVGRVSSCRAR